MSNPLNCSTSEWSVRTDLAALYRLAVHFGWTDLTSTHISARIPDDVDTYLLNTHDMMFDEIKASNLSKLSFHSGEIAEAGSSGAHIVNLAGHIIHSSVLHSRPDINYVIHSHTRAGIAVSAMPGGLRPLSQHAGFVLGTMSTHPFQDSTVVKDEGAALAADLGDNFVMLLENHGLLAVGRTAAEAFIYHYYLEMACKVQVDILSSVDEPIEISADAVKALNVWGSPENGTQGELQWGALMRMLDRHYPDFRT